MKAFKKLPLVLVLTILSIPTLHAQSNMIVSSNTNNGNRVLSLDGDGDYIEVSDSSSLHTISDAITLEVWFKAASFYPNPGNVNSIIRKNLNAGRENFILRFRTIPGGRQQIEMSPGLKIDKIIVPYKFEIGKWYHLAGTYNGSKLTVYLNGVNIKSQAARGMINIDDSDLYLGRGDPQYSMGEYFHGELDEIRIWNVARTRQEIKSTIISSLTGKEDGLVAYWNFNDGTAKDLSSGHKSSLNGDSQITTAARPKIDTTEAEDTYFVRIRQETLEALWDNINNIYPSIEYKQIYGPEWITSAKKQILKAKSDKEYYDILLELMASLKDTHTRFIYYPEQSHQEAPPVELNQVGEQIAVIRAHTDTGLSPGDIIVSIDGKAADECLTEVMKYVCNSTDRGRIREACSRLLRGTQNTSVSVTVRSRDSQEKKLSLSRDPDSDFNNKPVISSQLIDTKIGYIRISRWTGNNLISDFDQILQKFKTTKGIIIDVRGNGGGNDRLADLVNGRFVETPVVSSIDFWRKSGSDTYQKSVGWVKPRGPWRYEGRVAALIDEGSMSACEHFVSGLEAMGFVLLVGTPTNGAGGGPTSVTLPDGSKVGISRALGIRANGIVFEGHGIPPHIEITPTIEDLRNGRDPALEIAKEWIVSGSNVPARSQPLRN
ncbi:MAG: LamG-like jellyroll fold domain-containing protein [Planctomycetota bacterium]|jgi:C-terminal processing protease CtpA/Prc